MFQGVATALVTPFTANGEIHLEAWEALVNSQLAAGVQAIVVGGTTGEGATLSDVEFDVLLARAVTLAKGSAVVIAGTGSNNTAATIAKTRRAAEIGADGAMVVTPYYNKTTQAGLVAHFTAIADASPIPLMLYNVPSRTGIGLTAETVETLASHDKIVALKEASGDVSLLGQVMRRIPDGFSVYCGNDDQILPYMAWGAQGVVSVVSNVYPLETVRLTTALLNGNAVEARKRQADLLPIVDALFAEVNPIPVKAALNVLGFDVGEPRLPLVPISDGASARLRAAMGRYDEVRL